MVKVKIYVQLKVQITSSNYCTVYNRTQHLVFFRLFCSRVLNGDKQPCYLPRQRCPWGVSGNSVYVINPFCTPCLFTQSYMKIRRGLVILDNNILCWISL